jgi:hypothetical protein
MLGWCRLTRRCAAPSTTTIRGQLAIRAAIVNHRTSIRDIDALIEATLAFGEAAIGGHRTGGPC